MDNYWSRVRAEATTVSNSVEKFQENIRILRNTKVRPVSVMEMHDYTRFIVLEGDGGGELIAVSSNIDVTC